MSNTEEKWYAVKVVNEKIRLAVLTTSPEDAKKQCEEQLQRKVIIYGNGSYLPE